METARQDLVIQDCGLESARIAISFTHVDGWTKAYLFVGKNYCRFLTGHRDARTACKAALSMYREEQSDYEDDVEEAA